MGYSIRIGESIENTEMVKIKVSEASGDVLDWLVSKCKGDPKSLKYSSDWNISGPLIADEISNFEKRAGYYYAHKFSTRSDKVDWAFATHPGNKEAWSYGPTLLIACMRCYVLSEIGDTAEVPKELVK